MQKTTFQFLLAALLSLPLCMLAAKGKHQNETEPGKTVAHHSSASKQTAMNGSACKQVRYYADTTPQERRFWKPFKKLARKPQVKQ